MLCILSIFPSVLHYGLKFFVSFTTCANITVVLAEFFKGNDTIFFLGVPERHELHEEVSFGFESRLDFWVARCIVNSSDVVKLDCTITIDIKNVISFLYACKSSFIQFTLLFKNKLRLKLQNITYL